MASLDKFRDVPRIQRMPKNQQEWAYFINEMGRWVADSVAFATAQTDITTAQTTATTAQTTATTAQTSANNAGAYLAGEPGFHSWTSDNAGVFPAGNPTRDLTLTLYDNGGTQIAQRVLRGTLTSAAGTIAVTNVSSSGLTSAYALTDDGTASPRADITFTFADSSEVVGAVSWIAIDTTTASSTPGTGGGK